MRLPSVKTLSDIFGDNAKKARVILECKSSNWLMENSDAALELNSRCATKPPIQDLKLAALDEIGEFHGVEYGAFKNGETFTYLNSGDTYNGTLIRFRGNYRVTTLGDFIETMERQGLRAE